MGTKRIKKWEWLCFQMYEMKKKENLYEIISKSDMSVENSSQGENDYDFVF